MEARQLVQEVVPLLETTCLSVSYVADVDLIINLFLLTFSIVGDSDAGECPAPSAGGDCAGAVSNCWSPGQRDTGAFKMSS